LDKIGEIMKTYKEILEAKAWSAWCKNFRKDTEECTTGCPKEKIKKGEQCPFGGSDQENCACYK